MNFPEGLLYTRDHEWLKLDGETGRIGITDYAQSELGDIVFIELPAPGAVFKKGDRLAVLESVKAISDVYAPCGCEVETVNGELAAAPETINADPYGSGWIASIRVTEAGSESELLSAAEYTSILKKH